MTPAILGVIGPGFLNQVPTLSPKPLKAQADPDPCSQSNSASQSWLFAMALAGSSQGVRAALV